MEKCEQPSGHGVLVPRQHPPAPDLLSNLGGVAPVVRGDDWWARHWVGGGLPPGRISCPSSSATPGRGSPVSNPTGSHTAVVSNPRDSTNPTYSNATSEGRGSAEAHCAEIQARLALLPAKLLAFLKEFQKDGEKCAFYPSKISWLKQRGCPKLTVNFNHILQDERDRDLAFTVCNYQKMNQRSLEKAAQDFFLQNGFDIAEPKIEFENLPRRIYKAKDFLLSSACVESVPLFNEELKILVATTHGRRACDIILTGVLNYLIKGVSWCGQLTLDDILVIEDAEGRLKLIITRPPSIDANASGADRLSDLHAQWAGLESHYLLDGQLPLYFQELKKDIEGAVSSDIDTDWFHVYIRFHPAFYSSLSRSNFVCRVHQDYKTLNLSNAPNYAAVFQMKPPMDRNWQKTAKDSNFSRPVYDHRWRNSTMTEEEKARTDNRKNNMACLLEFYRHSVQHVDQNALVSDVDENELFTAKEFTAFLPTLIKILLQKHLMAPALASAWSNYKASKYDQRGPPQPKLQAVTVTAKSGQK